MGRKVAGCFPVRRRASDNAWEVLLVQSRWVPKVWLYPKGGVEDGETAKEAAVRETREEAGVVGRVGTKLGKFKSVANGQTLRIWILYVDEVLDDTDKRWKERKKRARTWVTFSEARTLMTKLDPPDLIRPELLDILQHAQAILEGKVSESDIVESDEKDDDG